MSARTVLVIGGSWAGISTSHYSLKHILPTLPKEDGVTYNVTMVTPSKDFYWRVAGPRACISSELLPESKYLYPLEKEFAKYGTSFKFVQGTATALDTAARTVTVSTVGGATESIPYYALILAVGTHTPAPFLSLQTDSEAVKTDLDNFRKTLPTAKTIVIGGGGPVGVEVAGEIAEFFNGTPGWFAPAKPAHPKAQLTLICADKKLLPVLREALAKTAEKYLNRMGCDVVYGTRVESTTQTADGKTTVSLSGGKTIEADLYVDATGARPNTGFLPKTLLNEKGFVDSDKTLRVTAAGERVYVLGDCGSYTRGGIMDMWEALPIVVANLKKDLSGAEVPDKEYKANLAETQVVPVGKSKGVGAFGGWKLPSVMVAIVKGKDYLASLAPPIVSGKQWDKAFK
ncbi:FAD/NAD(P)-binding domain-containing protein [Mytilinidion resinicola]|uniref:FAD/NAD(P)-binding domain-containing protein n=1 Tax=Mytilinidion resinicola TaxID=574789 RepID=A0A6A6YMU1_9PEZI|nr:FAD/NAD(P)-binding domain-containing protein [Mytilinidion resinicola]KAF2810206.1 FAD/NAD(P)-binding domain-containing protein [Mytilinidion resinicola]